MFAAKKHAFQVLQEALRGQSSTYSDPVVAEYMRVDGLVNDAMPRAPGASPKRSDDVEPALWAAVEDYYSRDESFALALMLTTVRLCNKYRLADHEYHDAVAAAYRIGARMPRFRAELAKIDHPERPPS